MSEPALLIVEEGVIRPVGASRMVQTDVRLVCATNRDLKAEVQAGTFRRDLFYRVNVFPIVMPPLRTRDGDVALLAQHMFHRFNTATGKNLALQKKIVRYRLRDRGNNNEER